jgi:hypothetical protein
VLQAAAGVYALQQRDYFALDPMRDRGLDRGKDVRWGDPEDLVVERTRRPPACEFTSAGEVAFSHSR